MIWDEVKDLKRRQCDKTRYSHSGFQVWRTTRTPQEFGFGEDTVDIPLRLSTASRRHFSLVDTLSACNPRQSLPLQTYSSFLPSPRHDRAVVHAKFPLFSLCFSGHPRYPTPTYTQEYTKDHIYNELRKEGRGC